MSSLESDKSLREKARCPICLEMMMKPMSIMCGHSYCHSCIVGMFEKTQDETSPSLETFHCPQCQAPFQKESIRPNKDLQSMIEAIKYLNTKWSCEEHDEKFQLFCEDDGQLICWRCERTPQHKGHNTALVKEVYTEYQENRITETKKSSLTFRIFITSCLRNKSYLLRLEMEKEKTLWKLQDNKSKLEKLRHELQEYIQEIERKCKGSTLDLLQYMQDTLKRSFSVKLELPEDVSSEVQTVCDISKLHFDANKS